MVLGWNGEIEMAEFDNVDAYKDGGCFDFSFVSSFLSNPHYNYLIPWVKA